MSEYLCTTGDAPPACETCSGRGTVTVETCGEVADAACGACAGGGRRSLTRAEERLQTVRLALAATAGAGAEQRDVVGLAAAVVGELLELRQRYDDLTVSLENLSSVASSCRPYPSRLQHRQSGRMIPEVARKAKWTTLPTSGNPR